MDCELPGVVVVLKEMDYETFKDICIAGEVSSLNTCSVENCELDHNNISNLLTYELAKSSSEVSEEVLLHISTKGNSFSDHECIRDDVKLSGAGNKLMEDKADSGLSDSSEFRDEPQTDQDPSTKAILADSSFLSKEENGGNNSNGFEGMAMMTKTRHGSDSLLGMILREKSKANAESEQGFKAENKHESADDIWRSSVTASLSRRSTVDLPEYESSSFSAASPPSGLLTLSSSIPYPDSISQRSNSTTSTRSFAFPILATECNDSPVRMAEADKRRHLKKPRFWGLCFNCCRI